MNYSPLAIHCTSLCFDVIQSQYFDKLTLDDIVNFKYEIYLMLKERTCMWPQFYARELEFLDSIACGVVEVLTQCRVHSAARSTHWVMSTLENRIDYTIKNLI
ncbi:hypothetical protein CIK83_10755 [Vibrio casei]|uniref:Uncharacterized protein n=1 Tax=Vibrio casei TaxID=673372 RepID=A0A368LH58_9VIBR|nr:hypothetical protein CIK83_10755 [Vibrio casei]